MRTLRVLPGEQRTTADHCESLVTVLGSCIAACVRDPATGFGGMNHFMLPESDTGEWNGVDASGRFDNFAMEALIDEVVAMGCSREALEIKVFGGADLYRGSILVGTRNVEFVLAYLARQELTPSAQDVGGSAARKIIYTPATGQVMRQLIRPRSDSEMLALERQCEMALRRRSTAPAAPDRGEGRG